MLSRGCLGVHVWVARKYEQLLDSPAFAASGRMEAFREGQLDASRRAGEEGRRVPLKDATTTKHMSAFQRTRPRALDPPLQIP